MVRHMGIDSIRLPWVKFAGYFRYGLVVAVVASTSFVGANPHVAGALSSPMVSGVSPSCSGPIGPRDYVLSGSAGVWMTSGPIPEMSGEDGTIDSSEPPRLPPGFVAPGYSAGVVSLPGLGRFAYYRSDFDPSTNLGLFWLVNGSAVLEFNMPYTQVGLGHVFTGSDGNGYLEATANDRSGHTFYRWKVDASCVDIATSLIVPVLTG